MEEQQNMLFSFLILAWLTSLSNNQFNVCFKGSFSLHPESPSGTEHAWTSPVLSLCSAKWQMPL